jgi:hypothetical protein
MATSDVTFMSLSLSSQRLVKAMQSIRYGWLRHLAIHNGEPVFDPPPIAVRVLKLDRRRTMPLPSDRGDFPVRRQILDLLTVLKAMKQGTIERLEIVDGLPVLAEVAEPLSQTTQQLISTPKLVN